MELEEFVQVKFEERYRKKDEEVSAMVGPQNSWSDAYDWRNPGDFSREAKRGVLDIVHTEEEAEYALEFIFSQLEISSFGVSGAHHGRDYTNYTIDTNNAIALANNPDKLLTILFERMKKERMKNIRK